MQEEKLEKTMELKPTEHTKMLWGSVEIKYERPKTQGQECESSGDVLEHSDNAVDFIEVVGEHVVVARLVSVEVLQILASVARNVIEDKNNMVVRKVVMMAIKLPTILVTPRLQHLWVNLTGESAGKHPGQVEQNLWVKHTTLVDQGQIISWMMEGMVEDLGFGANMAKTFVTNMMNLYRQYRQILKDILRLRWWPRGTVWTISRSSRSLRDFSPCFAQAPQEETRGCTTQ